VVGKSGPIACQSTNVCGANFACPGGPSCGSYCNPGFVLEEGQCIRRRSPLVLDVYYMWSMLTCRCCKLLFPLLPLAASSAIVTVRANEPDKGCSGAQLSSYSASNVTCDAYCQQGPSTDANLCGAARGVPTHCCYRSQFHWTAQPLNSPVPGANIQGYPYFSLPVLVRGRANLLRANG